MIVLNTRDPKPIYEQITNNLRRLIASGGIAPGERLPSVRELATRLTINPNTIQRAYRQLEQEGYIFSLPGKGCFAAEGSAPRQDRLRMLWLQLEAAAAELRLAGISQQELISHLTERSPADDPDPDADQAL